MSSSPSMEPTRFAHAQHALRVIDEVAPRIGQFQNIFGNQRLLKALASCPDIDRVDLDGLIAMIEAPFQADPWTPSSQYGNLLRQRSKERDWGLSTEELANFEADIAVLSTLGPGSVSTFQESARVWVQANLQLSWDEMIQWLSDEAERQNLMFASRIDAGDLVMRVNSRLPRQLAAVQIPVYWFGIDAKSFVGSSPYHPVGHEVLALLAMNPQMLHQLGTKLPNGIAMPALSHDSLPTHCPIVVRVDDVIIVDWMNDTAADQ